MKKKKSGGARRGATDSAGARGRGGARGRPRKIVTVDSDEELRNEEDPDPNSRQYIYDEIDEFHENREKALLDAGKPYKVQRQTDNEEVFSLHLSSDDDEDENVQRFSAMQQKDEMESDLEDEEDEIDETNWGKKRSNYYSSDYVDKDYQSFKEEDIELAEAEEREAKALQLKLAENFDDTDFGFDLFETVVPPPSDSKTESKIERDLSSMTREERLEILNRESPELQNLLNDFKVKLLELRDKYDPLMKMVRSGEIPAGTGTEYISCKFELLSNYCTNVCFYLMLKAKRTSLKYHPIIETLVTFRKLLKELEPVDKECEPELKSLLEKRRSSEKSCDEIANTKLKSLKQKSLPSKLFSAELVNSSKLKKIKKSVVKKDTKKSTKAKPEMPSILKPSVMMETEDEKNALELYKLMKAGRGRKLDEAESETDEDLISDDEEKPSADLNDEMDGADEESGKRGITYQIAKNKGLTPYRAKERRNPRVKYRMKFRKAKIRQKGQVREARKEIQKYGGEFSGIKSSTVRSIKLK